MVEPQGADRLVGQTLSGYRLTRVIARGGMGVVYEGVQESLDRPVAVKVLYTHLNNEAMFVERFEREARAAARLRHPNIVRILDFGSDNGLLYMVMDLVDGESLRERLTRIHGEGLTLRTGNIMNVVQKVGSALAFAHQLGYVHRDVKPGNILLAKDGQVFLSDFGVVKIVGNNQLTVAGAVIGTPEYMSPEQSSGELDIGPAADQYALAVVAYEMLVGRAPFQAPTPVAVMRMQANDPPPPPSTLVPWFPPATESVLLRAMAKAPADRFPDMQSFVDNLLAASAATPLPMTSGGRSASRTATAVEGGGGMAT
jgi:serine/threonine-protein kinase